MTRSRSNSRSRKSNATLVIRPPARRRSRTPGRRLVLPPIPQTSRRSGMNRPSVTVAPTSIAVERRSNMPREKTSRGGGTWKSVSGSELVISSLQGSTSFLTQAIIPINPGLPNSFPWLSATAAKWQQYRVKKLVVRYVPIAATSTQGEVMLVPEYDPTNLPPTTEVQAMNNYGAVADSCWAPFLCPLDVKAMMALGPRRFVRTTNLAGDIKTYDVASIFVCTNNQTSTSTIGKIYLDYEFEFFLPNNSPPNSQGTIHTSWYGNNAAQVFISGAPTSFGWNLKFFDPLFIGGPNDVFLPPAGTYRIWGQLELADTLAEAVTATVQFYKNGSPVATPNQNYTWNTGYTTTVSSELHLVMFDSILTFNGTDTFNLTLEMTGAGTLSVPAGYSWLFWALA